MATEKLFTVAGLTKHSAGSVTVEKARYGTDFIRLIKTLNNAKKIWHKASSQCLLPQRVDLVELPVAMTKEDALAFLAAHSDFQSRSDQATIQDAMADRSAKAPKTPKAKVAKPVKASLSVDAIKDRAAKKAKDQATLAAVVDAATISTTVTH